ncbi:MAG TPA: hypothetical protein PLB05_02710, partial [Candidatus Omnitrophota bacterium]|jgi:hypothetical protein|nr:hypothetical protein [Candidatus Omnitrophota bacterium]
MNKNIPFFSSELNVLPTRCGVALLCFMLIGGFQSYWIHQRSVVLALERQRFALAGEKARLEASLRSKTKRQPVAVQTGVFEAVIEERRGVEASPLPVFKREAVEQARAESQAEMLPPLESVVQEASFPHVNGIVEYQGRATVLIQDRYYEEGDFFQDYQIIHISPRAITIINTSTAEVAYLYFSEEAERMKRLDQALKTAQFHMIVQKALEERMKDTGTFDLFDKTINKVRKLKLGGFLQDVQEGKDSVYVPVEFQDILHDKNVSVIAVLKKDGHDWVIKSWELTAIEDPVPQVVQASKLELSSVSADPYIQ